jgi:hypothetical protein
MGGGLPGRLQTRSQELERSGAQQQQNTEQDEGFYEALTALAGGQDRLHKEDRNIGDSKLSNQTKCIFKFANIRIIGNSKAKLPWQLVGLAL